MDGKDYYRILEVTPDASEEQIKKSYRKLVKKYHPDQHPDDQEAARHFRDISEAYNVLSDHQKRSEYDARRMQPAGENPNNGSKKGTTKAYGFNPGNMKFDFADMMFDELNKEKQKKQGTSGEINYADVSAQFASFFGFRPK